MRSKSRESFVGLQIFSRHYNQMAMGLRALVLFSIAICYTNLCVPVTSLVAGLKNQALSEANATVRAIASEAKRRVETQT